MGCLLLVLAIAALGSGQTILGFALLLIGFGWGDKDGS